MKILSGEINCSWAHTGTSSPKTTHIAFLLLSLTFRNSTLLFVLSFFHLPVGWFMFPESWTVKLWMDPMTVTLSSLNLSVRIQYLPSPCPCFGPFSSSSLALHFYLVLVLVLSPHPLLVDGSFEAIFFCSQFLFFAVSCWTGRSIHETRFWTCVWLELDNYYIC